MVVCAIECAVESDRVGVVECDRFSCMCVGGPIEDKLYNLIQF